MTNPKSLGHYENAMAMRDIIKNIASDVVDAKSEQTFIGWTLDNRFTASPQHNLQRGHVGLPGTFINVATYQEPILGDDGVQATDDDGTLLFTPSWTKGVIQAFLPPPLEVLSSISVVRVSGKPGAYNIVEVLQDTEISFYSQNPGNLSLRRTFIDLKDGRYLYDGRGQTFPATLTANTSFADGVQFFANDNLYPLISQNYQRIYAPTIVSGQTVHLGYWENSNEPFEHGTLKNGILEVWIGADTRNQFSATPYSETGWPLKHYKIPLLSSKFNPDWMKVTPDYDSGSINGLNVDLEIRISNGTIYSDPTLYMRLRVFSVDTARVPRLVAGVFSRMEGDGWYYTATDDESGQTQLPGTIETPAIPTQIYGQYYSTTNEGEYGTFEGNGPFLPPANSYPELSQTLLSGGGYITYSGGRLNWTQTFLVQGAGKNAWCPDGRFESGTPAIANRNVPVFGSSTVTSVASSSAGVPLNPGQALYFELPLGRAYNYAQTRYLRIVDNTGTQRFEVPSHWVLLAAINPNDGLIKVGTGQVLASTNNFVPFAQTDTRWHSIGAYNEPVFQNGTVNYLQTFWTFGPLQFCKDVYGNVTIDGLIIPPATNTTMFVLPPGFRPATTIQISVLAGTAIGKVNIQPDGTVMLAVGAGASYLSFHNANYLAEDFNAPQWQYPTLASPFTNFGGGYNVARYYVDGAGAIHLGGLVTASPTTTTGTIFTLPVGARPDVPKIYQPFAAGGTARIDVSTAGVVSVSGYSTNGNSSTISLEGIVIPPPGLPWYAPTMANSWVANGGGYATASFAMDLNGVVYCRGLIKSGTASTSILGAGSIPQFMRRRSQGVYEVAAATYKYGRIDIMLDGSVMQQGYFDSGTNAYLCLDGISWRSPQASIG